MVRGSFRPLVFRGLITVTIPAVNQPICLYNSGRFDISRALRNSDLARLSEAPPICAVPRIFLTRHAPRISELLEEHIKLGATQYAVCKECFYQFSETRVLESVGEVASFIKSRGQTKYTCEFMLPRAKAQGSAEKLAKLGFKRLSEFSYTLDTADIADKDGAARLTEVIEATRRIAGMVVIKSKRNLATLKPPTICPLCGGAKKLMKSAPTIISELSQARNPRLRAFSAICKRLGIDSQRLATQLTQEQDDLCFALRFAIELAAIHEREALLVEEPGSCSRGREILTVIAEAAERGIRVFFTEPRAASRTDMVSVDCGGPSISGPTKLESSTKGAAREVTIGAMTSVDGDMPVSAILGLEETLADLFSRQIIAKTRGFVARDFLHRSHEACSIRMYRGRSWYEMNSMSLESVFTEFSSNQLAQLGGVITALGLGALEFSQTASTLSPREFALLTVAFGLNYPSGSSVRIKNINFLTDEERRLIKDLAAGLKIGLVV